MQLIDDTREPLFSLLSAQLAQLDRGGRTAKLPCRMLPAANGEGVTPGLLEGGRLEAFISWLGLDPHRSAVLTNGSWTVSVFKHQLVVYEDYLRRRRHLRHLG